MKVDYDKNLWIDYGAGEGGTLIDLVMHMERCDAGEAMRRLEQWIDGGPISSFIGKNTAPQRPPSIVVERVRPLENPALLDYLMERGIDLDTARMFGGALSRSGQILFRSWIPKRCRRVGAAQPLFQGLHLESPDDPTRRLSDVPRFRGIYGLPFVSDAQAQPEPAAQYRRAELGNEPCQSRSVHRVARTGLYLPRQ